MIEMLGYFATKILMIYVYLIMVIGVFVFLRIALLWLCGDWDDEK